jgi:branched-chain amino acid aminotransferase
MPVKPTEKIWMNGKIVDWKDATIHVLSHVVHYGSSWFEGIRCYSTPKGSAIFRLDRHISRLFDSAKMYYADIPYTPKEIEEAIIQTIHANHMKVCYIRPVAYRGYGDVGVNPLNNPVDVAIAVWEWGAYLGGESLQNGIDVMVSSWQRPAPNTLPTLAKAGANYANGQLIKVEALKLGFSEGIALDTNGYVSEGSGENIFAVKNGVIYTPPVTSGILSGVTRETIITLLRETGETIVEAPMPRELLIVADELFFTGTAAEVTPIRTVNKITVGIGKPGPVTKKAQQLFFDIVRNANDPKGWLTFID